jgi:hypothetical protein
VQLLAAVEDVKRVCGKAGSWRSLGTQYRFIIGWNRTDDPRQRCRVVAAGNPPTTPEGRWVVEEWAPWLDGNHPDPAAPGELRWYTYLDGELAWFRTGEPFAHPRPPSEPVPRAPGAAEPGVLAAAPSFHSRRGSPGAARPRRSSAGSS